MDPLLKLGQLYHLYHLHGQSDTIKLEIAKEVDIAFFIPDEKIYNKQDENFSGYNCLHIAALNSGGELVEYFISKGADLFRQGTFDYRTPLHVVIYKHCNFLQKNLWEMTGILRPNKSINSLLSAHVKSNNPLNPKCNNGISHFHIACMFNHVEAVEYFLKNGESVNQVTNAESAWSGYTALHFAVRYSSMQAIEVLLKHGADMYKEDAKGTSSLCLAVHRLLITYDYIFMAKSSICSPYKEEAQKIDKIICLMIENMPHIENKTMPVHENKLTNLFLACVIEDSSILDSLLDMNVNLNIAVINDSPYWPGWTPLHFAACISHKRFKLLLEHGAKFDVKNARGNTPVDVLMRRFSPEIIHSVLSIKQNFLDMRLSDNYTKLGDLLLAMSDTKRFAEFLKTLFSLQISIPAHSPIWPGYTILHLAVASHNKYKICEDYHDSTDYGKNSFPCSKNKGICTQEREFWKTRYWQILQICIFAGCNVSTKNTTGDTPIHMAFKLYNILAVTGLLRFCQKDAVNSNNFSIFHIACVVDDIELVQSFLNNGSDVNLAIKNELQWRDPVIRKRNNIILENSTALHMAVAFDNVDIVELLVANGANVNATNSKGSAPIHMTIPVCRHTEPTIAKLLTADVSVFREMPSKNGFTNLHVAAFLNDEKALKQQIEIDENIEAVTSFPSWFAGQSPLHLAAFMDCPNAVKVLVDSGANIHMENTTKKYETPLLYAVDHFGDTPKCFVEKLKLIDCGIGSIDPSGLTMLHLACVILDIDLARELLEKGADANSQIRMDFEYELAGFTPLHFVVNTVVNHIKTRKDPVPEGFREFVELLLKYDADVTIMSREKGTPLHMINDVIGDWKNESELTSHRNVVNLMLKSQKSYSNNPLNNSKENWSFSHFHLACVLNNVEVVEKFLESGVDIQSRTDPLVNFGNTGLHFATIYHSFDVARLLIVRGADVNARNALGNTAFHTAVKYKFIDLDLMKLLLDHGADIRARNYNSETPFLLLVNYNGLTYERLNFFLSHGCSIDVMYTPRDREGVLGLALAGVPQAERASILKTLIEVCDLKNKIQNGFNAIYNISAIFTNKYLFTMDAYLDIMQQFIDMGCDIDQREIKMGWDMEEEEIVGRTALHIALSFQNNEAVNALLLLGADINVTDLKKETPLIVPFVAYDHLIVIDGDNDCMAVKLTKLLCVHVWKMELCRFDVHPSNKRTADSLHEISPLKSDIQSSCQNELKKMEEIEIDRHYTVKDFLTKKGLVNDYITMPLAKREAIFNFFKDFNYLHKEFPQFCSLLMMKYRKIQNRLKMWNAAQEALLFVSQTQFPDLCVEAVFQFLSNDELKTFISIVDSVKTSSL